MPNFFISIYGEEKQYQKLKEECIELIIAIVRRQILKSWKNIFYEIFSIMRIIWLKRYSWNIPEEMGDVSNLISQFEEHHNDGVIFNHRYAKIKRQYERIALFKFFVTVLVIRGKRKDRLHA